MELPQEAKEFSIVKKIRSNYAIKGSSSCASTADGVDIASHQSSTEPYLYLLLNHAKVASVRRYDDESHTFVIKTHKPSALRDDLKEATAVAHLQRWGWDRGDMELALPDNTVRKLAWKNRGVYGERFELLDMTTDLETVLATFEVGGFLDRGGKLKIMAGWGIEFDKIAIASLLTLFEKQSLWGKTYDPRGGKVAVPVPRWGGETNLGACMAPGC